MAPFAIGEDCSTGLPRSKVESRYRVSEVPLIVELGGIPHKIRRVNVLCYSNTI